MADDETAGRDERSHEGRPLSDQERAELYREQLRQLHVVDLVRDMMVTLVTVGYEKLGLTEQTRELRDLGDARVAIESLRRLIEVVESEGDPEVGSLRSTLAQMQLNFARASAEPRPSAAAQPAPVGPTPAAKPSSEGSEADAHPPAEGESEPTIAPDAGAAGRRPATPKPAAKKPTAAKKPAAKKSVAKKPAAARKPAATKATPKKPAARKPPKPS